VVRRPYRLVFHYALDSSRRHRPGSAISDLLRVQPDLAWKKGEPIAARTGKFGRLPSSGMWSIRLRREDTDEWDVEAGPSWIVLPFKETCGRVQSAAHKLASLSGFP
jgi:hypothetical protein